MRTDASDHEENEYDDNVHGYDADERGYDGEQTIHCPVTRIPGERVFSDEEVRLSGDEERPSGDEERPSGDEERGHRDEVWVRVRGVGDPTTQRGACPTTRNPESDTTVGLTDVQWHQSECTAGLTGVAVNSEMGERGG